MSLYAHSLPGQSDTSKWQPLWEHLAAVASEAARMASDFDSEAWAANAGWLHDLGKADSSFQGYLRRENDLDDVGYDAGRVNHSSAGAAFAEDELKPFGRILAYLVAGHHAGLPDWDSAETGAAALSFRLGEGRANLARIGDFERVIRSRLQPTTRPRFVKADNFHFWVRMLFSCLVDADYLDTERFMEAGRARERGNYPRLAELAPRLFGALDELERTAAKTAVNGVRAEVRRCCEVAAEAAQGMFSLTVPTGGGKTLSAMSFAMRHALKHGLRRIVYVIPYTSIIEQTARTLADIFGRENVVEHHSNLDPAQETLRAQMAAENWDAPIIVTTNVQFFEALHAAKPGRCRKLHNVVKSVVILDEAQLLPPELLTPCVAAMTEFVAHYGVSLVLATATQPALPGVVAREIVSSELRLYERLKRVEYTIPGDPRQAVEWPALAAELQRHEQVLCIVNTRRDCHDLFKLLPAGTVHLSALMCGAHRARVIDDVKRRLKGGQSIRVISTQLVEAGVDIDFPVVYRALAGLDSIAQAAGRCNREGRLYCGAVHVFVPPKPAPRGLLLKGEQTARELLSDPVNLHDPETFKRYFALLYAKLNDLGSQFHDWLVKDVPGLRAQFRTAAEAFKLIDDQARQSVIVRYGDSDPWLERLRQAGPTREIMRALQRYTVSIPVAMAAAMRADGRLEEIALGVLAQANLNLYDPVTGLAVYDERMPVEDLIA